ncbi:MAG: hypothetical protein ACLSTZ_01250, partial [Ruminococcus bicirculans (ex Wegman et al. 2014)]|uniref:hypothetical protein n=1 Tax=Ruminococcus bicirculans (ex Wegman et al. 2014) TaxID=1160721 RepID=UPI003967715E
KKFSPTILNLQQILSTGEHCSPLQIVLERFFCRKIATLFAGLHLIRERVSGADFCSDITL